MGLTRDSLNPWLMLSMACAAVIGVAWLSPWLSRKRQRQQPPSKWKHVGKLTAITLYPLKSGRGTPLKEAECTETGLAEAVPARDGYIKLRDRSLAVYDAATEMFVTGRKIPRLLLIDIKAAGPDSVMLIAPDGDSVKFKLPQENANLKQIKMWREEMIWTADCGDEVAEWLSKNVAQKPSDLRLGYDMETRVGLRTVDYGPLSEYKKVYENLTSKDMGMYTDFSSFMLMSEKSVDDLREKVPADVASSLTIRQFRPTFVVSGPEPYEEDSWDWVRIGENVILRDVKPCTRCLLTLVHPDTAEKNKDLEPVRTLRTYRKVVKKEEVAIEGVAPVLGRYMGLRQAGTVKLGDDIYVPA